MIDDRAFSLPFHCLSNLSVRSLFTYFSLSFHYPFTILSEESNIELNSPDKLRALNGEVMKLRRRSETPIRDANLELQSEFSIRSSNLVRQTCELSVLGELKNY